MSYTPRPNASGDTLVLSRDTIRGNFEILQSRFQDNHTDFSSGTGKHKFLQMPEQASAPTTAVNEGAIYPKEANSVTAFFARSENNGQEYQLTRFLDAQIATFGTNTTYVANHDGGWTFLPGGLIMMYGVRSSTGASGTITFPFIFPGGTPFSVTASRLATTASTIIVDRNNITDTNFKYEMGAGTVNTQISWMAIGN